MEYGMINRKDQKSVALKAVEINGDLAGEALWVTSKQTYYNDCGENAEFIYNFPLPEKAAVCEFSARIGENIISGAIEEREKAFADYDKTIRQGDSAFLLEQVRANVFQISLGQIDAGEEVEIMIGYFQEILISDAEVRISIPTLLAPRYISGHAAGVKTGPGVAKPTDQVPDADYITPTIGKTDYRASIQLNIKTLTPLQSITSPSHSVQVEQGDENTASVILTKETTVMDRDFVLNIKLCGEVLPRLLYAKNQLNEYFALASVTPELPAIQKKQANEYIFLIDISGSMDGEKLEQSAHAMQICLRNLGTDDIFNMVAFESKIHPFSRQSLKFDQVNLNLATDWVNQLRSMGGTEILPAVQFALQENPDYEKIVLLFTDGQVGNEEEILDYVRKRNDNLRLYSVGIDSAVNDFFINRIAEVGNGFAEFVFPGENLEDKVIRHFSRIHASYMENVTLEMESLSTAELAGKLPSRLYDLEPFTQVLKMTKCPEGKLLVKGDYGKEEIILEIEEMQEIGNVAVLEKLWAKRKINELETYLATCNKRRAQTIKADIIALSQKYHILSSLTSFLGIYERANKLSGLPETIIIPVEAPGLWDMFVKDAPVAVVHSFLDKNDLEMPPFLRSSKLFNAVTEEPTQFMSLSGGSTKFKRTKSYAAPDEAKTKTIDTSDKLKQLAAMQNADGSFGRMKNDQVVKIAKTAQSIIEIAVNASNISIFMNQLQKALYFLMTSEKEITGNGNLLAIVCETIEIARSRKVIRRDNKELNAFADRMLGFKGQSAK